MARKSKYNQAVTEENSVLKQRIYKVGVYRRLSVEDGEDEINNSIGNQKKIADTIKVEVNFSDPFAPLQEYIKNVEEVLADAV